MKIYSEKLKDPRWQKKRLEILQRDEFTCQNCGDKENTLNVHHIAYSGEPWEAPNNLLITYCEECHKQEEVSVKEASLDLIKELKKNGFGSLAMCSVGKVFETDRGWNVYEPAFDILKMIVDDNVLWEFVSNTFWQRLNLKNSSTNKFYSKENAPF